MKVIGITGGVGAGKSTVLKTLKELCTCQIIMADDTAKDLMLKGGPLSDDAIRLFGKDAYNADGTLNTSHLSSIMYSDDSVKKEWTSIVHPKVNEYIFSMIESFRKAAEVDFLFIEAALLIENGYDRICDEIWYVYASEEVRQSRIITERGYTTAKVQGIFKSQMKDCEFRKHCSFVIDTSGSFENTRFQLENKLAEYTHM